MSSADELRETMDRTVAAVLQRERVSSQGK